MTALALAAPCVAIAWPDAREISSTCCATPAVPGMTDLRFRVFPAICDHARHGLQDTANAVG